ncbi:MAG TPA: YbjN domain-containing protein [Myxococcota bacterium]|nr:YbjN domain-containing protein [Myxococcota bacterium]
MGRIFNSMKEFFASDDWKFQELDGKDLHMRYRGDVGTWSCFARAREQEDQFVFYSVAPINTPPERRAAMAEFVTRANYGMIIGNFEMDFNDGEVRYKTSVDVEGTDLVAPLIRQLVYANVAMMNRYYSGILSVAFGGGEPAAEVARIEGGGEAAPAE